ncbi:MAG: hydroxymethylglutaryl-CoA lyase [Chthoniobacterales bacterium]|nr:hydroxymethylglutaryl-CoA lyase [Chthoniobacterales bacterium]
MIQPAPEKEQTVTLIECPRDAWQGLPRKIPTEQKVQYLRALIDAGFHHLDAASFVSPKAVPQMADSEAVLAQLAPPNDVEIIGIVVNEKGAERAIATGAVRTLGYPCSISETFLRRNQNQSLEENEMALRSIQRRAQASGLGMVVYISMAFGSSYGDDWSKGLLNEAVARVSAFGIHSISLADTVGVATPELIEEVMRSVLLACPGHDIGVHLHSTRAGAAAKVLAAYDAGCRRFDAALGGLGGCPFAQDQLVGNIPTEEVLRALEKRVAELPRMRDLGKVAALNEEISRASSA